MASTDLGQAPQAQCGGSLPAPFHVPEESLDSKFIWGMGLGHPSLNLTTTWSHKATSDLSLYSSTRTPECFHLHGVEFL